MSDNSIFNRLSIKLKKKFGKPKYGKRWPELNDEWYKKIHNENFLIHEHFKKYLKSKIDITTILEIGCGIGTFTHFIASKISTGKILAVDISPKSIDIARETYKNKSNMEFLVSDMSDFERNEKFRCAKTKKVRITN